MIHQHPSPPPTEWNRQEGPYTLHPALGPFHTYLMFYPSTNVFWQHWCAPLRPSLLCNRALHHLAVIRSCCCYSRFIRVAASKLGMYSLIAAPLRGLSLSGVRQQSWSCSKTKDCVSHTVYKPFRKDDLPSSPDSFMICVRRSIDAPLHRRTDPCSAINIAIRVMQRSTCVPEALLEAWPGLFMFMPGRLQSNCIIHPRAPCMSILCLLCCVSTALRSAPGLRMNLYQVSSSSSAVLAFG